MNLTEPALQNSVDRRDCICLPKMKTWQQLWDEMFGNVLVLLPIFSNMLIVIHAQPPSSMHSSGLDLIGYY